MRGKCAKRIRKIKPESLVGWLRWWLSYTYLHKTEDPSSIQSPEHACPNDNCKGLRDCYPSCLFWWASILSLKVIYSKDKTGLFMLMIRPLSIRDWAMPHLVTLATNDFVLPFHEMEFTCLCLKCNNHCSTLPLFQKGCYCHLSVITFCWNHLSIMSLHYENLSSSHPRLTSQSASEGEVVHVHLL